MEGVTKAHMMHLAGGMYDVQLVARASAPPKYWSAWLREDHAKQGNKKFQRLSFTTTLNVNHLSGIAKYT